MSLLSTLGSFLRAFTFGHVRQLDAVAARFLVALAGLVRLLGAPAGPVNPDTVRGFALLDVDDSIIEVHGHAKQGAGFGYSGVRGLNALLATLTTATSAPGIVAQRLRKGACGSPRGARRLVCHAVKQAGRLLGRQDGCGANGDEIGPGAINLRRVTSSAPSMQTSGLRRGSRGYPLELRRRMTNTSR
jgi:hypothetical protein